VSDGVQLCITIAADRPSTMYSDEGGQEKCTQLRHSYTFTSAAVNGRELIDAFISTAYSW
jgi:hypothetical protein